MIYAQELSIQSLIQMSTFNYLYANNAEKVLISSTRSWPRAQTQSSNIVLTYHDTLVIERSTTYLRRTALATVNPNQVYDGQTKEHKKRS